jgi:hypothetical protein
MRQTVGSGRIKVGSAPLSRFGDVVSGAKLPRAAHMLQAKLGQAETWPIDESRLSHAPWATVAGNWRSQRCLLLILR